MPTKDSGKPTSRRRPAAGKGPEQTAKSRPTGKGRPPSPQQPSPAPARMPRRRAPRAAGSPPPPASSPSGTLPIPLEPVAQQLHAEAPGAFQEPSAPHAVVAPAAEPVAAEPIVAAEQPGALPAAAEESPPAEEAALEAADGGAFEDREPEVAGLTPEHDVLPDEAEGDEPPRRRDRRGAGTNALGVFIERQFASPTSPAHSYSDLERLSHISREALSRYVTARVDRRRSPTIDTLVAIADALHVGLEAVARAAAASVKGVIPPPEDVQHAREETLSALVAALSDEQFSAVVELLRQMRPPVGE